MGRLDEVLLLLRASVCSAPSLLAGFFHDEVIASWVLGNPAGLPNSVPCALAEVGSADWERAGQNSLFAEPESAALLIDHHLDFALCLHGCSAMPDTG